MKCSADVSDRHRPNPQDDRPHEVGKDESEIDILDAIVNAQDGTAVQQLGSQVGLAPDEATAALSALMPVLAGGFQRNIQSQGGLESLMAALSSGNHRQYIDNPASLADSSAVRRRHRGDADTVS